MFLRFLPAVHPSRPFPRDNACFPETTERRVDFPKLVTEWCTSSLLILWGVCFQGMSSAGSRTVGFFFQARGPVLHHFLCFGGGGGDVCSQGVCSVGLVYVMYPCFCLLHPLMRASIKHCDVPSSPSVAPGHSYFLGCVFASKVCLQQVSGPSGLFFQARGSVLRQFVFPRRVFSRSPVCVIPMLLSVCCNRPLEHHEISSNTAVCQLHTPHIPATHVRPHDSPQTEPASFEPTPHFCLWV